MPVDEEKIYPAKSLIFFGVLNITVWIAVSSAACWLANPLLGWLFLGFSAFSVLIVIRRQMCSSCYYCASCSKGFAKLSKLFLGGKNIPGVGKASTAAMVAFIYILLAVTPAIILASSMLQEFSLLKLAILASLLSISIYNVIARAKNWAQ